ncbi:MAG TPA: hypothetical protein VFM88_17325 [Vicinamibacteria bacterium]|nr:hypothetical protein [Vicinamibacteria bacterium]
MEEAMKKRETLEAFLRDQVHKQGVLLEGIAEQNRATIEAVQASRTALEERIDRFDRESRERDSVLEATIKTTRAEVGELKNDVSQLGIGLAALNGEVVGLKTDVAGLKTDVAGLKTDVAGLKTDVAGLKTDVRELKVGVQQNSVDIRELSARVAVVERLDERVAALERRAG